TWTSAALCVVEDRPHWMFAALEGHGERALLTVYLANRERVTYEDAAVECVVSALSLGGGAEPVPTPDRATMRDRLRGLVAGGAVGGAPVPGGGELGARVGESLAPLWALRETAPPPDSFTSRAP